MAIVGSRCIAIDALDGLWYDGTVVVDNPDGSFGVQRDDTGTFVV